MDTEPTEMPSAKPRPPEDGNVRPQSKPRPDVELDYVRMLNGVLPEDIRILGACPVAVDFSARHHCQWREYKYFFLREDQDIDAMTSAATLLQGSHDFRNFCKMDAKVVSTFVRLIHHFQILPVHDGKRSDTDHSQTTQ